MAWKLGGHICLGHMSLQPLLCIQSLLRTRLLQVKLVITKVSEIVLLRYNQDLRSSSFPHLLDQLATDLVAQAGPNRDEARDSGFYCLNDTDPAP